MPAERPLTAAGALQPALVEAPRPVLFVHVSKAGGTLFLDMASRNYNSSQYPTTQDNMWTGGDGPTWCCNSPPVEELDCAERERRMRLEGWRIAAIERYLDNGGQLCPQFDYVTLLRDPIDRVFSHVNHWFHNLRMASHYPVQIADPPMPREAFRTRDFFRRVSRSDCTTTSIREAILDMDYVRAHRVPLPRRLFDDDLSPLCGIVENYQTRSLLGTSFAPRPFSAHGRRSLDAAQLGRAQSMLERFKLVLTIDDFGSASSRVADELESALGWTNTTIDPSHSNTHHYEDVLVQSETGADEMQLLRSMNAMDAALYERARWQGIRS